MGKFENLIGCFRLNEANEKSGKLFAFRQIHDLVVITNNWREMPKQRKLCMWKSARNEEEYKQVMITFLSMNDSEQPLKE